MTVSVALPWWAVLLLFASAALIAYGAYARPVVPLSGRQRATLTGLRLLALLLVLVFLLQPTLTEPAPPEDAVVPVLIDRSRSMRLTDADGERRLDQAIGLVREHLAVSIGDGLELDLLSFGDEVAPADLTTVQPDASRTDLVGALESLPERYRGRTIAGVVLVSDGGDTSGRDAVGVVEPGRFPVFALGVGAATPSRDREAVSLVAGEAQTAESVVDVMATAVSHGFGDEPVEMRLLEDGQLLQVRRLTTTRDGAPVRTTFSVSPKPDAATLYTLEIPAAPGELVAENNRRSVLVRPPGRARRLLMIEGGPGYDHSFLKRAWLADTGLALDAVVRKGQNDRGEHTFYVQGAPERTSALATGFPSSRTALFGYDALVLANIESEFFDADQLALVADFVDERGGGLLFMGSATFGGRGFMGSPVERLSPIDLTDRRRASTGLPPASAHTVRLTDDGARHPIMQLGATVEDTRVAWNAVPPLGGSVALGAARPGATVLAHVYDVDGSAHPLAAVQRVGSGRSFVFTGEAAWRWKMLQSADVRTYETFWGQAARWLTAGAMDPLTVTAEAGTQPGDTVRLDIRLRDHEYAPVVDASPVVQVVTPSGERRELSATLADAGAGGYAAEFGADEPGVYRATVTAPDTTGEPMTAEDWILVGGSDVEFADPARNNQVLRRIADASGGRLIDLGMVDTLPAMLAAGASAVASPRTRDLWHGIWSFLLVIVVLGAEWSLRRVWGLR